MSISRSGNRSQRKKAEAGDRRKFRRPVLASVIWFSTRVAEENIDSTFGSISSALGYLYSPSRSTNDCVFHLVADKSSFKTIPTDGAATQRPSSDLEVNLAGTSSLTILRMAWSAPVVVQKGMIYWVHRLISRAFSGRLHKDSLGGLSKYLRRAGHNHPSIFRSGQRYQLPPYSARVQTNRAV